MPRILLRSRRIAQQPPAVVPLRMDEGADRVVRLASQGVLAYVIAVSLICIFVFVFEVRAPRGYLLRDVVAAAAVLPLQAGLVASVARGIRSRGSWWLLAGGAGVVLGMIPFGGVLWLLELQLLAGLVLLAASPPWSVALFAVLVALPVAVAHVDRAPSWSTFMAVKTLQGGLSLAVLVWLVQTIRRARAAQQELAEQAVIAERLRVEAELARAVTAALEHIIAAGQDAAADLGDPRLTVIQMEALAAFSRRTLAQTRRMLTCYQEIPADAELQTATALLSVAGVRVTLDLPPDGMPRELSAGVRGQLRSGVARMLADDAVTDCVIAVAPGHAEELDLRVIPGPVPTAGPG